MVDEQQRRQQQHVVGMGTGQGGVDGGNTGPWRRGVELQWRAVSSIAVATRRTVIRVVAARTATRPSRPLCCVTAKQFLNETILWYMSKEVEDKSTCDVNQSFSF